MSANRNHRPFYIRLVNKSTGPMKRLGVLQPLTRDLLLDRARAATGLDDFGDDDFLEGLDRLLESLERDAHLNAVGWLSVQTYLLQLLTNRLNLEADRRRHMQIGQQAIDEPIFIIGLPRTGSTFLYELLSRNCRFRAPRSWEVMYPSPPPNESAGSDRWRKTKASISLSLVDLVAPEFKKIHPVGAELPQECIAIQTHAFRSIQFHTTNRVNSYQQWLETADWTPAYIWHKRFLQHIQLCEPKRRWLLKAPGHLYSLDALFNTYPDAHFVHTHRDPLKVIPSIASHCLALRQAFSDEVDPLEIAKFWAGSWHRALESGLAWRRAHPELEERFLDIHFPDLVQQPMRTLEHLYDFVGENFTPEVEAAIERYIVDNPQHKHGTHQYTLEEFGLSAAAEKDRFKVYTEAFGIPFSTDRSITYNRAHNKNRKPDDEERYPCRN